MLDDGGSVTDRYAYQAYGLQTHTGTPGVGMPSPLPTSIADGSSQPFTFVGQQGYYRDPELDLYFLKARYYDFATARFLSADPVEDADTNRYRYCANDPVNAIDPSGNAWFKESRDALWDLVPTQGQVVNTFDSAAQSIGLPSLAEAEQALNTIVDIGSTCGKTIVNYGIKVIRGNDVTFSIGSVVSNTIEGVAIKPDIDPVAISKVVESIYGVINNDCTAKLASAFNVEATYKQINSDTFRMQLGDVLTKFYGFGLDKPKGKQKEVLQSIANSKDVKDITQRFTKGFEAFGDFPKEFAGNDLQFAVESLLTKLGKLIPPVLQKEMDKYFSLTAFIKEGTSKIPKLEIPGDLRDALTDIAEIFKDVVTAKFNDFVSFFTSGVEWIEVFEQTIYEQLWPWPSVGKSLMNIAEEIGNVASRLTSLGDVAGCRNPQKIIDKLTENLTKALNHAAEIIKHINGMVASLSLWIWVFSMLVGSIFPGIGTAAGGNFAATIGVANAAVQIGTQFAQIALWLFELFLHYANSEEATDEQVDAEIDALEIEKGIEGLSEDPSIANFSQLEGAANGPENVDTGLGMTKAPTSPSPAAGPDNSPEALINKILDNAISIAITGIGFILGGVATRLGKKVSDSLSKKRVKPKKAPKPKSGKGTKKDKERKEKSRRVNCKDCNQKNPGKGKGAFDKRKSCRNCKCKKCTKSPCPVGKCFAFSVLRHFKDGVRGFDRTRFGLSIGRRIATWYAGEMGYEESLLRPDALIVPESFRIVSLIKDSDGYTTETKLLRSWAWMEELGVESIGDKVVLDMPEMGAEGEFEVMDIAPCPEIETGAGRVVTGEFCHSRGVVYNLVIAGESEPIKVTAGHPIWSMDREDWIEADKLLIGERLQIEGRSTIVLDWKCAGEEPVFNLEVDADHCYRVGEQGILVHNASTDCRADFRADVAIPTDQELYNDAVAIFEQFPDRSQGYIVVATSILTTPDNRCCHRKVYAVSSNSTAPTVRAAAMTRGYARIIGASAAGHTHAEQFILDYAQAPANDLLRADIDTPIAPNRPPCDLRVNPRPTQQGCGMRMFTAPGVRIVYLGNVPWNPPG